MARQYNRTIFNEKLISEVEKRIPLWDSKHPDYKDSKVLTILWQEIGLVMDLSVKEVMERWRNLRDTFVRHLRKIKESKRIGNEEATLIRWPYFKQLLFLRPSINHRKRGSIKYTEETPVSDNETANVEIKRENSDEEGNSTQDYSLDFLHSHLQLQMEDDAASQVSVPHSNSSSFSVFESTEENHCNSKKRKLDCSPPREQEILKNSQIKNLRDSPWQYDDVDMFVLSLAPHLRKVPPQLYGLCQMNMLQIAVSFSAGIIPNKLCNPFSS